MTSSVKVNAERINELNIKLEIQVIRVKLAENRMPV